MSQTDIEQAINASSGASGKSAKGEDVATTAGAAPPGKRRGSQRKDQLQAVMSQLAAVKRFCELLQDCHVRRDCVALVAQCSVADLGFEDCSVYMFNPQFTLLEQWAAYGPENPSGRQLLIPIKIAAGEGVIGEVAATGQASLLQGEAALAHVDGGRRRKTPNCSRLLVPIVMQGEVLGVIDSQDHKRNFHQDWHQLAVEAMASALAARVTTLELQHDIQAQLSTTLADLDETSQLLAPPLRDSEKTRLEALTAALHDDALRLFAQPIYAPGKNGGEICAFELFARIDEGDDERGPHLVAAADWLPVATRHALIGDIDRWVFAAGLQWLGDQHQRLAIPLNLHFNVAVTSLLDMSFLEYVEQELRSNRNAAGKLFFECDAKAVSEIVQQTRPELAAAMHRLAALGCRFVLDGADANTISASGYLPFDVVKLDCREVPRETHRSQFDRAGLLSWRYTLEMSHTLGKQVGLKNIESAPDHSAAFAEAVDRVSENAAFGADEDADVERDARTGGRPHEHDNDDGDDDGKMALHSAPHEAPDLAPRLAPWAKLVQGMYFDTPMPLTAITEAKFSQDSNSGPAAQDAGANVLPR